MKVSLALLLLAGSLGSLNGASFDRGAGSTPRYSTSTASTTSAPVTSSSTSASTEQPDRGAPSKGVPEKPAKGGAPVWNPASGEFDMDNSILGGLKERNQKPKVAQEEPKEKYGAKKANEAQQDSRTGWFGGRFLRPAAKPHPQGCPPCPCLQNQQLPVTKPGEPDDAHRSRRATNDDYWHSTGPANPVLSQVNMGYSAQMQMQDFFSKYGFPLHIGSINQADFNYPNDFSAFEQPATAFQNVKGTIVYRLTGPVEMVPFGNLAGPIPNAPDAFRSMIFQSGIFKLLGIQKDGIMKVINDRGVPYLVYCSAQRVGNCQNLVPTRDVWDIRVFDSIA